MSLSYKKLKVLMAQYDLQLQDIHNNAGISWGTIAKINKGDYINSPCLERICEYLNKVSDRYIDIGDIVEINKK